MSKNNTTAPVAPETAQVEDPTTPKKPNAIVRGWRKIKENPKAAFAVVGGTALVAVAAYMAGSASSEEPESIEPEMYEGDEEPTVVLDLRNH